MESFEIIRQYMMGAMKASSAIDELEKSISTNTDEHKLQEAAKARYGIGFIRRVIQNRCAEASPYDLCLNIRDLILFMGRIKLTEKLYNIVRKHGNKFDLVCESDYQVSCMLHYPEWIAPTKYIDEVYSLRPKETYNTLSIGDSVLSNTTIFKTYKSFEQKIAVNTALNLPKGKCLLVSQPTGGGKSLVTQMIAGTSQDSLTVVIVPTVALALDQYYAAQNNLKDNSGIFCYRGGQTENERKTIITAIKEHKAKLLFTSPEAILKNTQLKNLIDKSAENQYLNNVVIDEAHVVPDWGVFFRPEFQIFSILLQKWKRTSNNLIRTYLLSATLSDDVVNTLFGLFGTDGENVQVRCDALRQEPRFYFQSVKSRKEQIDKTIEAMMSLPKPMVIYVLEPREAIELKKELKSRGFSNIPIFTGETKVSDRDRVLQGWKNHEFDVVLATSAFGIGVDKPDVRTIIHSCCPENLSRYYQEVGRGGRDGLPSISLFMPYQSKYDSEGDVKRALGLVNKRVLTVERAIIRWMSMLKDKQTILDGDKCTLDASTAPYTMTPDEADFVGNRNIAWNINLLLFFHRIKFIELIDADFLAEDKTYKIRVKLIRTDILDDTKKLKEELAPLREKEYKSQMEGYYIIRDLASNPTRKCWGKCFKNLFPLSQEVCNGCPFDPEGRVTIDSCYKVREKPELNIEKIEPSSKLARNMGDYSELIVSRKSNDKYSIEEIEDIAAHANNAGIGSIIVPNEINNYLDFNGMVLTYDEFYFASNNLPYLFSKGVICLFSNDISINTTLYKYLGKIKKLNYSTVLYCNEQTVIGSNDKLILEGTDCYNVPLERL